MTEIPNLAAAYAGTFEVNQVRGTRAFDLQAMRRFLGGDLVDPVQVVLTAAPGWAVEYSSLEECPPKTKRLFVRFATIAQQCQPQHTATSAEECARLRHYWEQIDTPFKGLFIALAGKVLQSELGPDWTRLCMTIGRLIMATEEQRVMPNQYMRTALLADSESNRPSFRANRLLAVDKSVCLTRSAQDLVGAG